MSLINNLLALIEHSLGHLKPGIVLFCVLLPRKQADTVMALNNSHDYGLRTSLAEEVKGQMSIVTVFTFAP